MQTIFPPSSWIDVLSQITELSDDGYETIKRAVRSKDAFDLHQARCEHLSKKTGLTAEGVALVLNALSFLYNRLKAIDGAQPAELIRQLLDDLGQTEDSQPEKQKLVGRISDLVSPSEEIDTFRKLARLRNGFLQNATGFGSFVDVRPDFETGNVRVKGFVPVIQFRIVTDADPVAEREFIFQIDEPGLKLLRQAVESAEQKLATLMSSNVLAVPLHVRKWTNEDE